MLALVPPDVHKIIFAPLNWGLGHATRSIPLIRTLLEAGKEVVIASDGEALSLLQKEFLDIVSQALPPYKVRYSSSSLWQIIISNSLNVSAAIRKEKRAAEKLVRGSSADMIISDSRFGFRSEKVPSVIITHQLSPIGSDSLLSFVLERGNRKFINAFDACWVPDDAGSPLSGKLSRNPKIRNVHYIGTVSRLKPCKGMEKQYDVAMILSGPEPARTKLEKALLERVRQSAMRICLVRGTERGEPLGDLPSNLVVYDLADSATINEILCSSEKVISRSGYTSVMDYSKLGISAYLIPTPGQTEQEYLAEHLDGREGFVWVREMGVLDGLFQI